MGMEAEVAALEKLIKEVQGRFSDDEVEALKRVAARERAWIAVGFLAGSVKMVLTYIGFFLAAWAALKAGILDWLRGAL